MNKAVFYHSGSRADLRFGAPSLWLRELTDLLLRWQMRAEERTHLAELDDHLLRDLGLTRADVEAEVTKPFWRA